MSVIRLHDRNWITILALNQNISVRVRVGPLSAGVVVAYGALNALVGVRFPGGLLSSFVRSGFYFKKTH